MITNTVQKEATLKNNEEINVIIILRDSNYENFKNLQRFTYKINHNAVNFKTDTYNINNHL